jgi:hypothetical protein
VTIRDKLLYHNNLEIPSRFSIFKVLKNLKIIISPHKISGVELPNAISVRFATVSFHTFVVI